jgi:hypothetical protein
MLGGNVAQDNPKFVAPANADEEDVQYQYYLTQTENPNIDAAVSLRPWSGWSSLRRASSVLATAARSILDITIGLPSRLRAALRIWQ